MVCFCGWYFVDFDGVVGYVGDYGLLLEGFEFVVVV